MRIRRAGDAALLVEPADDGPARRADCTAPAALAAAIREADLPGLIDVVPAAQTVLVSFDPAAQSADRLAARLRQAGSGITAAGLPGEADPLVVDTVYDGPDLAGVAALAGLTVAEVIARHTAAEYRVGWLGFSPGFGYLTGLDPALDVPRLDSPRLSVPAGSVAIAGGLAAVYPAASPGGWRLLGRTDAPLWVPGRNPPAMLAPGRQVRFRAVSQLTPAPATAAAAQFTDSVRQGQDETYSRTSRSSGSSPDRWIEILQPGPLTTIQDLGRPGFAHLGVPRSGAADIESMRQANRLAGNEDGAACLEVTLGRLALRFGCAAVVGLAGAPATVRLTEAPPASPGEESAAAGPGPARPATTDFAPADAGPAGGTAAGFGSAGPVLAVPAGAILRLGPPAAGLRTYLAVRGGIAVTPVLGSRSADVHSGLGPPPVRAGDRLPLGPPRPPRPPGRQQEGDPPLPRPDEPPRTDLPRSHPEGQRESLWSGGQRRRAPEVRLRVLAGPRDDWFIPDAMAALTAGSYQVTAASNRTGLRLAGPALRRARDAELPSEGMACGSLQVTHNGQPILLLADHPTTGGYPVIAVVLTADLPLAAQLRPGQRVRFEVSS